MSVHSEAGPAKTAGRMDEIYRNQRHFYDLTRKYYLLGRDALIADLAPPRGASMLEVGCGTGRNIVVAGRHYADTSLFGIDISAEMLSTACKAVRQSGLATRTALARADACDFNPDRLFGQRCFDRIFLSYTLSMIPPWRETLAHLPSMLAPGGSLHIVDFGQQEGLPDMFKRALFAWLRRFDVEPRAALPDCLADIADTGGLRFEMRSLHRGYAWSAVLRRSG